MDFKGKEFILNNCFPDASSLFSAKYRSLEDCQKTCLVTLDTNVLLAPYAVRSENLQAIRGAYEKLLAENRLFIIGHVVREFSRRKNYMLADLAKSILDQSIQAAAPIKEAVEILRGLKIYDEAVESARLISESIKQAQNKIAEALSMVQSWQSNDPVSDLYRDLFSGVVKDLVLDDAEREKLLQEWKYRTENKIPPGYKDSNKEGNAEGDFLIWKTILAIGAEKKLDLVFVTGEEKEDWWIRAGGRPYFPRLELLDEYRRASDGHTFHMLNFPKFLLTFGVSNAVVEEVEKVEVEKAAQRRYAVARRYISASDEEDSIRDILSELPRASQLEIERISLQRNIRRLRVGLSNLPLDANASLSLPWNRAAHVLRMQLAEAENRLAAIEAELVELASSSPNPAA